MFVITSLLPLPVSAAYAAGQTLYNFCIIRTVVADANRCPFRFTLQSRLPFVVLFCFECKQVGGVMTIKAVDTLSLWHTSMLWISYRTRDVKTQSEHWSVTSSIYVVLNLPNP